MTSVAKLRRARISLRAIALDIVLLVIAFATPVGFLLLDCMGGAHDVFQGSGAFSAMIAGYLGYRSLSRHFIKFYRNTDRGSPLHTSCEQAWVDRLTLIAALIGTIVLSFGLKLLPPVCSVLNL